MEIPDEKLDYQPKITRYKDIAISEAGINYKSNWWHLFHLYGNSDENSKLSYEWNHINRDFVINV